MLMSRMQRAVFVIGWFGLSSASASADPEKLALPIVPSFDIQPIEPGFHHPKELLVGGQALRGKELKVKGYITWIYDCRTAIAKPRETPAQAQRRIDADMTLCERPKFYLASTTDTPPEHSLWVVDVPRPPYKIEKERLPAETLAAWPPVPRLKLGDYVIVTGTFALSSPHNERNSDGLLIYSALEHAQPGPVQPPPEHRIPPPRPAVPPPVIAKRAPTRVEPLAQRTSVMHGDDAAKAYGQRRYAAARTAYEQAINAWPDNHVAHYGLAAVHMANGSWKEARDALATAIQIAPDQAPYHLMHGHVQYEAAVQDARDAQAAQSGAPPASFAPDLSAAPLDGALVSYAHALRLDPGMWRAHYGKGRIYRARGQARWAAEEFDSALRVGAREQAPWIALCELYRRWAYADEALAVALQGTSVVAGLDLADIWYEVGMAYDDKRKDAPAIDAFTRSLELRSGDPKATFQRGQVYFRAGDFAHARRDLEDFVKSDHANSFAVEQAKHMLVEIAAKPRGRK